jgi:hypothetical protein
MASKLLQIKIPSYISYILSHFKEIALVLYLNTYLLKI